MASKRSIPTTLFASPDFFELSNNTIRLILIGMILDADDEGRGCAHPRLLARKLDQSQEDIEQALEEFAEHGILQCYEVAGRRYYWLCHWQKYQTLSKPTPSLYPAPSSSPPATQPQRAPEVVSRETQESPGPARETPPEGKRREKEEKRTEAEENLPVGVTRFPAPASSSSTTSLALHKRLEVTEHVASLLHLPVSEELSAVVQEFLPVTTLSVTGEAIEAHAWITDTRRNERQQPMTPAFFRRWLRRAQQGTRGLTSASSSPGKSGLEAGQEPAAEQDQYAAYVYKLMEQYNEPEELQRVV